MLCLFRFFFHAPSSTLTYTLSLHDALPIYVMAMMTEGRFRHLPVIEQGKLLGIVSIGDVVKRRIDAAEMDVEALRQYIAARDRKSTRLNSSHPSISYAVFCLKKKNMNKQPT